MGGKWTSFRHMGEETVDVIKKHNPSLDTKYDSTQTLKFNLIGSYSKVEAIHGVSPVDDALFT